MKENIKKIGKYSVITFFVSLAPFIASAEVLTPKNQGSGGGVSFPNPIGKSTILELVNAILDVVVQVGTVIAVLFLVYAGFLFVLARGNEAMLDKAKMTFFWTIIGGVIILGAFVLSDIIRETAKGLGANIK